RAARERPHPTERGVGATLDHQDLELVGPVPHQDDGGGRPRQALRVGVVDDVDRAAHGPIPADRPAHARTATGFAELAPTLAIVVKLAACRKAGTTRSPTRSRPVRARRPRRSSDGTPCSRRATWRCAG